ncbi:early endosome antigen 1 [Trichonephila inaurata madagascariensis]|uniref:Early endosome antigen 1 n=1 Tax=Trichonephila inaurata madagascariensis TaxID=2747483 RepID=A0A8X6I9C0_9ARAC|nr:early endosome antigen 1 [Trichonephila inaurata madagascariensis]
MFNNFRGILNRRGDQAKAPEGSRTSSENNIEANPGSAEGFLCPTCMLGFPSPEALQNHYESSHIDNEIAAEGRGFNCPACKMKLGSEIELNAHFTRHHASQKEVTEIEAMNMQIKALEEAKALLQGKLQAISSQATELTKENANIREERDNFKLKATKLTDNLADLKLQYDDIKAKKSSLEASQKTYEERIRKLEVEINQRPEADDVTLLQKELVSVQKMMNELTLQRESEKDNLQKQCNSVQEMCLKLQEEKMELQNTLKTFPSKDEINSLQEKVSVMSKTVNQLQKELEMKESEKKKLQNDLDKCANYQEIKSMLSEKSNTLEEVQRLSTEKDTLIEKLKNEIETCRVNMEEMKVDREKLFSKIEEGEGASAAMLQLREENARLKDQILLLQQMQGKSENETESKLEDLRSSLKAANSALEASNEKCSDLERNLAQIQSEFEDKLCKKENLIEELNGEINTMKNDISTNVSELNKLKQEIEDGKTLLNDKNQEIETLKSKMIEQKQSHEKHTDYLTIEKQNLEKRLADLGKTLPQVQANLLEKENKLAEVDKKLQQAEEKLSILERDKKAKENEFIQLKKLNDDAKLQIENLQKTVDEFEATKIEFCDKISSLNEERLKCQMKESELTSNIEQLHKSQLIEKSSVLEEENKNLRTSVTTLQNEKNCLLSELDKHKNAIVDINEINADNERKIVDLKESCQKATANAEKILKDSNLEKEIYLKDKVKLQKQLENLENDCAKQLSLNQETVKSLENQLEEAEERIAGFKSSLIFCVQNVALQVCLNQNATFNKEESDKLLKQKDAEWEEKEAHHTARIGVLTENIRTLKEDLTSEQRRRESLEQKLDEISGTKLELEAKLENALEERNSLLERCLKSETECERLQKISTDLRRKYDDCVAALQELGRENQTLQVENMKHITRKWADDGEVSHCTACGKLFSLTIRKHHCRNCGNIFCNECSAKTATVAASKNPVRVCDICYDEVTK